jgi:hypothetical protein
MKRVISNILPRFSKRLALLAVLAACFASATNLRLPPLIYKAGNMKVSDTKAVVCSITNIKIIDLICSNNGTSNNFNDDFYTLTVRVKFNDKPTTGVLLLSGSHTASIPVAQTETDTSHNFTNLTIAVGTTPIDLNYTATFSAIPACTFTKDFDLGLQQCTTCPGSGASGVPYPACWPPEGPNPANCDNPLRYAPDPANPEATPIKYIRAVVHVFQKESGDPENFTEAHLGVIKSWFDGAEGMNHFLGNLCPSPDDNSPDILDSRIRIINTGIKDFDVFFHQNNRGWGTSFYDVYSCPCGDCCSQCDDCDGCCQNCGSYNDLALSTMETLYVDGGVNGNSWHLSLDSTQISALSNPEIRNAYHFFITAGKWRDCDNDDTPDPAGTDSYNLYPGGFTTTAYLSCENDSTAEPTPLAIFAGAYETYKRLTIPGYDTLSPVEGPLPSSVSAMGVGFIGELYHVMGIDHLGPLRAHFAHSNGDDGCDDTPWDSYSNVLGCDFSGADSTKCALSQCQLGKIHYFFEELNPAIQRFPEGGGPHVPVGDGSYNMIGNCDINEPDIVINAGENRVWDFGHSIRSNVVVKSGGKLTIRCDVGFPEDASIIVEEKGQLVVSGARLYNNCDGEHWQGIIVKGDPNLTQDYDITNLTYYQGKVKLQAGTIIEEAKTGVSSVGGGIVSATSTEFLNCLNRGVEIRNYQNWKINTGLPKGNASSFSNCKFVADNNYSGTMASDFYEMVLLRKVDGINIEGCAFENTAPASLQNERKFGINASNAGFTVGQLCTTIPCIGGTPGGFSGFDRAIYVDNSVGLRNFGVSNCSFNDNVVGIEAFHVRGAFIASNNFEVGCALDFTIPQPQSVKSNRGILLYDCTGYQVEDNTCNKFSLGAVNPIGILVNASGYEPNQIYRNHLRHFLDIGNLSNGLNKNPNDNLNKGLQYFCNDNFNNLKHDIAVGKENGPAGIRKNQGSSTNSAGNLFSPVYPSAGQTLHINNSVGQINYFYVNALNQEPTKIIPAQVNKVLTFSVNNCPSTLPNGFNGTLDPNEQQQHEQDFSNTSNGPEKRALAADALFRHYLLDTVTTNLAAVRAILTQRGDLISHFGVVDAWLQENNSTEAQTALNAIPTQFTLTGEDLVEYNHFNSLKSLQIAAMLNGTSDELLVANNLSTITQIAEAGTYYAASQAKSLLNSVNGFTYTPSVYLPEEPQLMVAPPQGGSLGQMEPASVEAQPNPAKQHTVFRYCLPEGMEHGRISVTDLSGREVASFEVTSDAGSIEWSNIGLKEGIYFYSLETGKSMASTKRLVLMR